jgi:hypothetical protein
VASSVVGGWVRLTPGRSTSQTEFQSDDDAPKGKSVFFYLLVINHVCLFDSPYFIFWRTSPTGFYSILSVSIFFSFDLYVLMCYILGLVLFGFLCAGSDVSSLMPGLTRGQIVSLCF